MLFIHIIAYVQSYIEVSNIRENILDHYNIRLYDIWIYILLYF